MVLPLKPTHNFTHTLIGRVPGRIPPRQGTFLEPRSSHQGLRLCRGRAWSVHQLGRCFENGQPVTKQGKPYKKRREGVAIRSHAAAA